MSLRSSRWRRRGPEERAKLLSQYYRAGLTQAEFAARHELSLSCLRQWLRRFRAQPKARPPAFLEVPIDLETRDVSIRPYRVCLPSGLSLEVFPGFHPYELKRLLQLLRES